MPKSMGYYIPGVTCTFSVGTACFALQEVNRHVRSTLSEFQEENTRRVKYILVPQIILCVRTEHTSMFLGACTDDDTYTTG